MGRKKTNEQFLKELEEINPNVEPLEEYITDGTKIKCKCKVCEDTWYTTPDRLLNKRAGCPKCAGNKKITNSEFLENLKKVNPKIQVLSEYVNCKTKIKYVCSVCGEVSTSRPYRLLTGVDYCKKCAIKKSSKQFMLSEEEFKEKLKIVTEDSVELLSDYIGVDHNHKFRCSICGNIWEAKPVNLLYNKTRCPNLCTRNTRISNREKSLLSDIMEEINDTVEENKRFTFNNTQFELDIYFPNLKLGIEFDGLYWHSFSIRGKNYQVEKREFFKKHFDIDVIFVREDEYVLKKEIVLSKIKNLLGLTERKLYARNLSIDFVSNKIKNIFLDRYHIQGRDSSSIKIGLYTKEHKIVSIMTFSKNRMLSNSDRNENIAELTRFASRTNINVIGGFSKLLKFAEKYLKELGYTKIKTYADRRYSKDDNNVYLKNGFTLNNITNPNYIYFKGLTVYSRQSFQKKNMPNMEDFNFDESLTEYVNAMNNGWESYYDCGNLVYYKDIK